MTELKVDDKNVAPVVEKLFDEILAPNTDEGIGTDNMTAIWIKLYNDTVTENWSLYLAVWKCVCENDDEENIK